MQRPTSITLYTEVAVHDHGLLHIPRNRTLSHVILHTTSTCSGAASMRRPLTPRRRGQSSWMGCRCRRHRCGDARKFVLDTLAFVANLRKKQTLEQTGTISYLQTHVTSTGSAHSPRMMFVLHQREETVYGSQPERLYPNMKSILNDKKKKCTRSHMAIS